MMTVTILIFIALLLDWLFGEPKRWHPLVGFGLMANKLERYMYGSITVSTYHKILRGACAVLLLLLPITVITWWLSTFPLFGAFFSISILTLAIGHKSLHDHAQPIADAINSGDEQLARQLTSRIVSRDPETLHIQRATIESILENGSDSVFAAIFWFVIAGAPGVIFYRLANTLDAMWGYRNSHYLYFGRFAARLDDALNYFPARLTALTYSLLGNTRQALSSWKKQAYVWDSPNAGPVMAAGAGALNITLGGAAKYDGQWHHRITLGCGHDPDASDISRALELVRHSIILWLIIMLLITGLIHA